MLNKKEDDDQVGSGEYFGFFSNPTAIFFIKELMYIKEVKPQFLYSCYLAGQAFAFPH